MLRSMSRDLPAEFHAAVQRSMHRISTGKTAVKRRDVTTLPDTDDHAEQLGQALDAVATSWGSRPDLARMVLSSAIQTCTQIEKGRKSPSADALETLAAALELTPSELVERAKDLGPSDPVVTRNDEAPESVRMALVEHLEASPDDVDQLTDSLIARFRPVIRSAIADAMSGEK